jgi:hypothetical protein
MEPINVLILADESANWKIAGIRQLDRLSLALNEFAESSETKRKIDIGIFWKPEIPLAQQWAPRDSRQSQSDSDPALLLGTRLLVSRNGLANFISVAPAVESESSTLDVTESWEKFARSFELACHEAEERKVARGWRYIAKAGEVPSAERWLLRQSGKSQDGIVSRFLNRPISAAVSYLLLKFSIAPKTWTFSSLVLPLVAFFFLLAGDYAGFVAGTAIFQVYSILDGCDGEIARAKYMESEIGAKLDKWCDVFGGFLFAIGLGLGLCRRHASAPYAWSYLGEAVVCIAIVTLNELRLQNSKLEKVMSSALNPILYPRHRELIQHSGILFLGAQFVWWLVQLTKRDLAVLVFLGLAIAGRPEWILPLWIAITGAVLSLAALARRKVNRQGVVAPIS